VKLFPECNCCHEPDVYGSCHDPHIGHVCPDCLVLLGQTRRLLGLSGYEKCTLDRGAFRNSQSARGHSGSERGPKIIPPPL